MMRYVMTAAAEINKRLNENSAKYPSVESVMAYPQSSLVMIMKRYVMTVAAEINKRLYQFLYSEKYPIFTERVITIFVEFLVIMMVWFATVMVLTITASKLWFALSRFEQKLGLVAVVTLYVSTIAIQDLDDDNIVNQTMARFVVNIFARFVVSTIGNRLWLALTIVAQKLGLVTMGKWLRLAVIIVAQKLGPVTIVTLLILPVLSIESDLLFVVTVAALVLGIMAGILLYIVVRKLLSKLLSALNFITNQVSYVLVSVFKAATIVTLLLLSSVLCMDVNIWFALNMMIWVFLSTTAIKLWFATGLFPVQDAVKVNKTKNRRINRWHRNNILILAGVPFAAASNVMLVLDLSIFSLRLNMLLKYFKVLMYGFTDGIPAMCSIIGAEFILLVHTLCGFSLPGEIGKFVENNLGLITTVWLLMNLLTVGMKSSLRFSIILQNAAVDWVAYLLWICAFRKPGETMLNESIITSSIFADSFVISAMSSLPQLCVIVISDSIGLSQYIYDRITAWCTYQFEPEGDFGDMSQMPTLMLERFLDDVPDVSVEEAILGTRNTVPTNIDGCLVRASSKLNANEINKLLEKLRRLIDHLRFDNILNLSEKERTAIENLTADEKLCVRLYTVPSLEGYPCLKQKGLFRHLNDPFKESDRYVDKYHNQKYWMKSLIKTLRKMEWRTFDVLYRGVHWYEDNTRDREKYLNYRREYALGAPQTFAPMTSVSASKEAAMNVGSCKGLKKDYLVLFVFHNVRGVNIAPLSDVPTELEVLWEAPSVFEVVSAEMNHGWLVVTLKPYDHSRGYPELPYLSR